MDANPDPHSQPFARQLGLFDGAPPAPSKAPPPAGADTSCAYWDYCPNCGHRLHNAGCKYRCPRCHYFMSCSDFD